MVDGKKPDSREDDNYEELMDLGFELESPQDEYSYQPDSGGAIGGIIGRQEYGIDTVQDAQDRDDQLGSSHDVNPADVGLSSQIESSDQALAALLIESPPDDSQLERFIDGMLKRSPYLADCQLATAVHQGQVVVSGQVPSVSARLRIIEMLESLPAVSDFKVELSVQESAF
ncbi:MAG: BON domain-containing protein [Deltaproteobacteria bacterium]|nr:BON domain-containing protein [Deltaproteobacteria bacterium]